MAGSILKALYVETRPSPETQRARRNRSPALRLNVSAVRLGSACVACKLEG
jgi:hypothetical protein